VAVKLAVTSLGAGIVFNPPDLVGPVTFKLPLVGNVADILLVELRVGKSVAPG
jgi:hypothetical protein